MGSLIPAENTASATLVLGSCDNTQETHSTPAAVSPERYDSPFPALPQQRTQEGPTLAPASTNIQLEASVDGATTQSDMRPKYFQRVTFGSPPLPPHPPRNPKRLPTLHPVAIPFSLLPKSATESLALRDEPSPE